MNATVPSNVPIKELLALKDAEKIALIETLWDSIDPANMPTPSWQLEELEVRDAADSDSPEPLLSWDEAQQRARAAHAKSRSA